MKYKRFLSFLISISLIAGGLCISPVMRGASTASAEGSGNNTAYGLASKAESGNILHCNNWYYSQITDRMQRIAEQGFSAVQVSPLQGNKRSINSGAYLCDWTFFYQPVNFEIGNELGSRNDFKRLCETAKSYGVKVIVDVVANHLAQGTDGRSGSISDQIDSKYVDSDYYHNVGRDATDTGRDRQVLYNVGGLPDLNTANTTVQGWVYDMLEDCVSLGADGFRFDTAKHIETSQDGSLSSNFWQNTAIKIKNEYPELFMYGEVIDLKGTVSVTAYTDFMSVSDAGYGIKARRSFTNGNVSLLATKPGKYDDTEIPYNKGVIWAESHDEFFNGSTALMSESVLVKTYAALASRKDCPTLFFARPSCNGVVNSETWDNLLGETTSTWRSKEIQAVNRFKNAYEGKDEKLASYDNKFYVVERGGTGLCIVNAGSSTNINLPTNIPDGSYTDSVSGNVFTVSNGKITGTMASSGVAVIYMSIAVPTALFRVNGNDKSSSDNISFSTESIKISVVLRNASSAVIKIAGNEPLETTEGMNITLGADVDYGYYIPVTISATNGDVTTTETYKLNKKNISEEKTVYFDAPAEVFYTVTKNNPKSAGVPYVYAKDSSGAAATAYPGQKMTAVTGTEYEHLFKCTVSNSTSVVKFNDGVEISGGNGAHTVPSTAAIYGDSAVLENCKNGGLNIIGSMLWTRGKWIDVRADGTAYEAWSKKTAVDIENRHDIIDTSTDIPVEYRLYGDIDNSGNVSMSDVTEAQRYIASLVTLDSESLRAGDVTDDKLLKMDDVTLIQKYIAGLVTEFISGAYFEREAKKTSDTDEISDSDEIPGPDSSTADDTDDTDTDIVPEDTDSDVVEPQQKLVYFKNTLGWSRIFAHCWTDQGASWSEWPGTEMVRVEGNLYVLNLPTDCDANRIIFNDGGNGTQTADIHMDAYGMIFEPTVSIGTDIYGNTIYTGTWDGEDANYDKSNLN